MFLVFVLILLLRGAPYPSLLEMVTLLSTLYEVLLWGFKSIYFNVLLLYRIEQGNNI